MRRLCTIVSVALTLNFFSCKESPPEILLTGDDEFQYLKLGPNSVYGFESAPIPFVYLDYQSEDTIVKLDQAISVNFKAVSGYLTSTMPEDVDFSRLLIDRDGFDVVDFNTGIFSPDGWLTSTENPDIYEIVPGERILNGQIYLNPNRIGQVRFEIKFENIYGNSDSASISLYCIE